MANDPTARVAELLQELVGDGTQGPQRGIQAAAYLHGELVVDAWAGMADPAAGRPVAGDTLFTVYSAGKVILSTCVHLLAERGLLDYDAPVAQYWPEFAANGKAGVTVRHALTHRAGIPYLPPGTTPEALCDWEGMCVAVAALTPLWEPGTRLGYHAATFGWILGEVVRRVDGRPFGQFVQEEICAPLDLDGQLYFGIPDAAEPRVATAELLAPPPTVPPAPDAPDQQAMPEWMRRIFNRPDVRRACFPAAGGLMTARALARHYAALIGAGVGGVRLLPPERVVAATVPLPDEPDIVWGIKAAKALGYLLGGPELDAFPALVGRRHSAFGFPGIGGNIGYADPEYGLAVAILSTGRGVDPKHMVAQRIRAVLGIPEEPAGEQVEARPQC